MVLMKHPLKFKTLQANFTFKEEDLCLVEVGETSTQNADKTISWSVMMNANEYTKRPRPTTGFSYNEDEYVNLIPTLDARKLWELSCIGRFIDGSFDFSFEREQAFKIRKNKGV